MSYLKGVRNRTSEKIYCLSSLATSFLKTGIEPAYIDYGCHFMENVQNLQIKLNGYISHTVSCKIIYNGDNQNHTTRLD